MNAIWLNDIHRDFLGKPEVDRFLDTLHAACADAVLIAGDIAQARSVARHLKRMNDRLEVPICFVLGNHDFYHGSTGGVRSAARRLPEERDGLRWFGDSAPVSLAPGTSLIGHDG